MCDMQKQLHQVALALSFSLSLSKSANSGCVFMLCVRMCVLLKIHYIIY